MLLSQKLSLTNLIQLCRNLRVSLGAGMKMRDVVGQLAERGPHGVRPVVGRIRQRLAKGDNFHDAIQSEAAVFPPLFIGMVSVGEETGQLPEILEELEDYYLLQQKQLRQLRSRATGPVLQFVFVILVVTALIFILGGIPQAPEVFGFRGASGAVKFLALVAGVFGGIFIAWLLLKRTFGHKAGVDGLMLRLPVIGPCVQAFALSRFALALQLTLDTSMPPDKALRLSLEATGNAAFASQADITAAAVEQGEDLMVALSLVRFLPVDFLATVAVGEEAGRLVEMMRKQAAHYQEEASRRLQTSTRFATGLIWLVYATFAILAIFHIAGIYFAALKG